MTDIKKLALCALLLGSSLQAGNVYLGFQVPIRTPIGTFHPSVGTTVSTKNPWVRYSLYAAGGAAVLLLVYKAYAAYKESSKPCYGNTLSIKERFLNWLKHIHPHWYMHYQF